MNNEVALDKSNPTAQYFKNITNAAIIKTLVPAHG